jgi:hypothetical protein
MVKRIGIAGNIVTSAERSLRAALRLAWQLVARHTVVAAAKPLRAAFDRIAVQKTMLGIQVTVLGRTLARHPSAALKTEKRQQLLHGPNHLVAEKDACEWRRVGITVCELTNW